VWKIWLKGYTNQLSATPHHFTLLLPPPARIQSSMRGCGWNLLPVNDVDDGACGLQTRSRGRIREHGMSMDVTIMSLVRTWISNSSRDRPMSLYSAELQSTIQVQHRLVYLHPHCLLMALWKVTFGSRRNRCYRRKSNPIFPKGASGQRCRSLRLVATGQVMCVQ
jgi:hypothetical protein